MKKHFLLGVISIMFLLFLVTPSNAITIGFDPVSQTVPVGDTAEVALGYLRTWEMESLRL